MDKKIIEFPKEKMTSEKAAEAQELNEDLKEKKKAALEKLPQYRGEVRSKTVVRSLPNVRTGEIFWLTLEDNAYVVVNNEDGKMDLRPIDANASVSAGLTLLEFNKMMIAQEPLIDMKDEKAVQELILAVSEYVEALENTCYMLYGRELHYFTIFKRNKDEIMKPMTIIEAIANVGAIISIEPDRFNEALEIWVKTKQGPQLMYFFPFDKGLVEF